MVSCGKKRTVHGRVYNPVTGNGIAGMGVYVMKDKTCLSYDGCADKAIESTTTDANGYYLMQYRDKGGLSLLFDNDIDAFYRMNSNIPGISGNQEYDLLLVTKGYLQKTITNLSCFDANDKLTITSAYHKSIPELSSTTMAIYEGCMNQTYSNSYVPMGWRVWKGIVTKNSITTPFADSIYVPEGGSVQWSIEY
ncbi:MAG TPA: carboxypeptidase regulatory-like domain-containing protein [Crocinitomix sp.]|nr:carboxypeptidase regulatory-like domain-containing protein [Crocinitomix sp.]